MTALATRASVGAIFGKHHALTNELTFLEDLAAGKAPQTLVTPSLECLQDGQFIELDGSLIASLARDRLPAVRAEVARLKAKIDQIEAIVREVA